MTSTVLPQIRILSKAFFLKIAFSFPKVFNPPKDLLQTPWIPLENSKPIFWWIASRRGNLVRSASWSVERLVDVKDLSWKMFSSRGALHALMAALSDCFFSVWKGTCYAAALCQPRQIYFRGWVCLETVHVATTDKKGWKNLFNLSYLLQISPPISRLRPTSSQLTRNSSKCKFRTCIHLCLNLYRGRRR